jgi:hypothetical protein
MTPIQKRWKDWQEGRTGHKWAFAAWCRERGIDTRDGSMARSVDAIIGPPTASVLTRAVYNDHVQKMMTERRLCRASARSYVLAWAKVYSVRVEPIQPVICEECQKPRHGCRHTQRVQRRALRARAKARAAGVLTT